MGKKYEHTDYSKLLAELKGNQFEKELIEDEQGKTDIETDLTLEMKESLLHGMTEIGNLRTYEMRGTYDYEKLLTDVINAFETVDDRSQPYWKELYMCMGQPSVADIERILTHLIDMRIAYLEHHDYDVYHSVDRLVSQTSFLKYTVYLETNGFKSVDDEKPVEEDVKPKVAPITETFQKIQSDEKIKYVITDDNVIHEKTCSLVKKLWMDEWEFKADYEKSAIRCPQCALRAYIRAGAKDIKQYDQYVNLFEKMGITEELARKMYIVLGFKTKLSNMNIEGANHSGNLQNAVTIWHKEDTWKIGAVLKNRVRLEHNNYIARPNKTREFVKGFHVQRDELFVTSAIKIIDEYQYENHFVQPTVKAKSDGQAKFFDMSVEGNRKSWIGSVKDWISEKILRKKNYLYGMNQAGKNGTKPVNGTVCLYQWVDEAGKKHWCSGIYRSKKKDFWAYYGDKKNVIVPFSAVTEWIPLTDIMLDA